MEKTFKEKAIKNTCTNIIFQVLIVAFTFLARMVFIRRLNAEYLGANSFFSNVLTVLSIIDAGIAPSLSFYLYKPLMEKNYNESITYIEFCKKIFYIIGSLILVLGLISVLFYKKLMSSVPEIPNLNFIYVVFVINMAFPYFFTSYQILINADQKNYIIIIISGISKISLDLVQIFIMIFYQNYTFYVIAMLLSTIITNLVVYYVSKKEFPFLSKNTREKLSNEKKNDLLKYSFSVIPNKIGNTIIGVTDNLLLSKFIGIIAVGIYGNYILIKNALNMLTNMVLTSVTSSIGSFNSIKTDETSLRRLYYRILFLAFFVSSILTTCFISLSQEFITIFFGNFYLLPFTAVLLFCISFFLECLRQAAEIFQNANGLYKYLKFRPIAGCLVNLIASLILLKTYGVSGIIMGTIISQVFVLMPFEIYVVTKYNIKELFFKCVIKYVGYFLLFSVISLIEYFILSFWNINSYLGFFLKGFTSVILAFSLYSIVLFKTDNYKYYMNICFSLLKKLIGIILNRPNSLVKE